MLHRRTTNFVPFLICLGLLVFAAYLQYHLGLAPCPLCVLQRLLFACLALIFFINALYIPLTAVWRRVYDGLIVLFSGLGVAVALRHVWLEFHPLSAGAACSPSIQYMLKNLSFNQTLALILRGSGDCSKVTWQLLNLSIPQWTLIFFGLFTLYGLLRYFSAKNQERYK